MGIRFRRSIKLAPGIRMNLSGSGLSWSLGPRGASMTFGKRGTYVNAGIPGTGLYTRERIDGHSRSSAPAQHAPTRVQLSAKITVDDDGLIKFMDADGNPLSSYLANAAKRQNGEAIRKLIKDSCDVINRQTQSLGEIHLYTPDCRNPPTYKPKPFTEPEPWLPAPTKYGFMGYLFKFIARKIDAQNLMVKTNYEKRLSEWNEEKKTHNASEMARKQFVEKEILQSTAAMETFLEENLHNISWPRETTISFEIMDAGRRVLLDVDLPEIEEIPKKIASVPSGGYRLNVKDMSAAHVQTLYMHHVHGIAFRIIGEAFSVLPTIQEIVLSAYSQRPDRATGKISNEYLYSVRVHRPEWEKINFDKLAVIDVIEALNQFELRRDMSKTGIFKAIEPFAA